MGSYKGLISVAHFNQVRELGHVRITEIVVKVLHVSLRQGQVAQGEPLHLKHDNKAVLVDGESILPNQNTLLSKALTHVLSHGGT